MKFNFIHFSDTHLGDHLPKLQPSDLDQYRGNDFLKNYLRVIDYINKNIDNIDFILHTGDFFDSSTPPLYLREIVVNSLSKIIEHSIPMYILVGNHEKFGFPNELTKLSPNIHIIENSKTETLVIKREKISITGIPYMKKAKTRLGQDFITELNNANFNNIKSDYKILLFHQIVEGARVGADNWRFPPMKNVVPLKVIPKNFNYVGVGHIHKAQVIKHGKRKVFLPGATERITFSEVLEPKGFYRVFVKDNMKSDVKFISLHCRKMFEYEIHFSDDSMEVAQVKIKKFLNMIKKNSYGKFRFTGQISYDILNKLDLEQLKNKTFICHFFFKKLKVTHPGKHVFLIKKNDKKGCNLSMIKTNIENFTIKNIPSALGLYLFYKKDTPIYIGKSKSIRRRVREMISESSTSKKMEELFKTSDRFEVELFENEIELLLRENFLIEKFKPQYNIQKTSPIKTLKYINVSNINGIDFLTLDDNQRNEKKFLGPFLLNKNEEEDFHLFLQLMEFPICNGNIADNPNLCYQFLLNACPGPCKGKRENEKYKEKLANFFHSPLMFLKKKKFNFEKANQIKLYDEYYEIFQRMETQKMTNGIFIYSEKNSKKNLILLKHGIIKKVISCKTNKLNECIKNIKKYYKSLDGNYIYNYVNIQNFNILIKLFEKSGEFIDLS